MNHQPKEEEDGDSDPKDAAQAFHHRNLSAA
jgi:hypothetical protein